MADIPGVTGSMDQAPASDEFEPRRHLLKPVAPETLKGLSIYDLRAYADGKLAEGVFTLVNDTNDVLTIKANNDFATGLSLMPKQRYKVHQWASYTNLTLEVNDTGESIKFTNTNINISANNRITFYVVANDGA